MHLTLISVSTNIQKEILINRNEIYIIKFYLLICCFGVLSNTRKYNTVGIFSLTLELEAFKTFRLLILLTDGF